MNILSAIYEFGIIIVFIYRETDYGNSELTSGMFRRIAERIYLSIESNRE